MTDKAASNPMGAAQIKVEDSFYDDQMEAELNAGSNQSWNAFTAGWKWLRGKFSRKGLSNVHN